MTTVMVDVSIRTCIAGVLLLAAAAKLSGTNALGAFISRTVGNDRSARTVAVATPYAEAVVAIGLLAGLTVWPAAGATAFGALSAVLLAFARRRGVDAACRCFGPLDDSPANIVTISRATGVAVLGLVLVLIQVDGAGAPAPLLRADVRPWALVGLLAAPTYVLSFGLLDKLRDFERRRTSYLVVPQRGPGR